MKHDMYSFNHSDIQNLDVIYGDMVKLQVFASWIWCLEIRGPVFGYL